MSPNITHSLDATRTNEAIHCAELLFPYETYVLYIEAMYKENTKALVVSEREYQRYLDTEHAELGL